MTARVLREGASGPREEIVELWELEPGDVVIVKNGEQVPVDGTIVHGVGGLDEAMITGESIPAEKKGGDQVFAGTWLRSGALRVEAVDIGSDTTLAKIIHRVEDAQDDRAKTQTFLEKFSRWYTPAVMISAILVGLITHNTELALTLLVIGCPGALVISIPVSIVAGIGRAARDGILIKGGEYLEQAAKVDAVVVDKTGTLTLGRPALTDDPAGFALVGNPGLAADVRVLPSTHWLPPSWRAVDRGVCCQIRCRNSGRRSGGGAGITGFVPVGRVSVGTAELLDDAASGVDGARIVAELQSRARPR